MQIILLSFLIIGNIAGWQEEFSSGEWESSRDHALLSVEADSSDSDSWAALSFSEAVIGNIPEAMEFAENALDLDSLSGMAWAALGRSIILDDVELALHSYEKSLDLDSTFIPGIVGKAHCLVLLEEYEEASIELNRAMDMDSSWISLWLETATVLEYQLEYEKAFNCLTDALEMWPDNRLLLLEVGWLMEMESRYESAEETYRRISELYPDDIEALLNLGLLFEEQERFGFALKAYRDLLVRDPEDYWCAGEIGLCLEMVGNLDGAIQSYMDGIDINPDYIFAMYRLGSIFESIGNIDEAIQWYIACVKSDPHHIEAWIDLGLLYENLGRYSAAETAYRSVLEVDSSNTWTWGELGIVLENLGRPEEAGEAYENGIKTDSEYLWAWEQRGLLFEESGDLESAAEWFQLAIDTTEPGAWLLGELGFVLEQLEDTDSAIVCYRNAILVDTTYLFGFQRLAPLEAESGNAEEAIRLWDRFLQAGGSESTALCERILLFESQGSFDDADSVMNVLADQYPSAWIDLAWSYTIVSPEKALLLARRASETGFDGDSGLWSSLAGLYSSLDEHSAAESCFVIASEQDPDNPDIWIDWGYYLFDSGQEEAAAEKYEKVIELDSLSFSGWSGLGEAYLFADQYDEAIAALERSQELDPESPWIYSYLGLAFEQKGYSDKALDYYFQALSISPGYDYAETRVRSITDTGFDPEWNRRESGRFNVTISADVRIDNGNVRERNYSVSSLISCEYDSRGSSVSLEADYSFIETSKEYANDYSWSMLSFSVDRILSDYFSVKANSKWDRQPGTVRPWQISSYLSFDYTRWVTDWLWISPGLGIGQVNTHWASGLEDERTDRTTLYGSLAFWISGQDSRWPTLWLWGDFYQPPGSIENTLMNGLAEVTFDMWDPLSLTVGYSVDYTRTPAYRYWDKYNTEFYSRLNLRIF
ncbi:MAG: tetratricopeptide repeat protein [Candidatus Aegiribacteria sp.]|nr:tetratricopeptide repeat protein [Candidatus Aegiribacteria sp.]